MTENQPDATKSSILYQEIHQQPTSLQQLLDQGQAAIDSLADAIRRRNINYIFIAARGTSDNAARYAKYLFGSHNGLPVALAAPSLFTLYEQPPQLNNALVLGISQSGRSPDLVAVLAAAHQQGALTASITNDPTSPLADAAEHIIPLHAGDENAVAATKTYTAQLLALAMLSASLASSESLTQLIPTVPDAVAQTLALHDTIRSIAPRYRQTGRAVVIGRGYNYSTAFETALKMKELTYTLIEPYSSADFLHGPFALLETDFPVLMIAPAGKLTAEMIDFGQRINGSGAELIVVSDEAALLQLGRVQLPLPASLPEWLSPISAIIPGQIFALELAALRGYNVDAPRAIHKVTETR